MCNICNQSNCGCEPINVPCGCGDTPCVESPACDCAVSNLGTKCLVYSGETLECTGIEQGVNFDEFLLALDAYICTTIAQLQSSINLINVGDGAEVYAGIDNLGKRKIRSITETGNLIDIVQNTDTINIAINETNLNAFIEANQKTYTALNVGTGATLFKNLTTVGDINTFNFKSVILDAQSGLGESFIRDVQQNANDVTIRHKKLNSSTLTITSTDEEVLINTPSTSTIPALYVNNLYVPSEEEFLAGNTFGDGSAGKPFTDTVTAYVAGVPTITPNTAIQNALDAYVGSGTRLSPELVGQKIIIQDNNSNYTFTGNFGYSRLVIDINANVTHTLAGMLIDMDNATHFNTLQDRISISVGEGYSLTSFSDGFNNSGSNVATTNFVQLRTVTLLGEGTIYFPGSDITKYIINSDISGIGNANDGGLTFDIKCTLRADLQGIVKVGGVSKVYNYASIQSGTSLAIDTNLKAFLLLGGQFRNFKTANIEFGGTNRVDGFVFTPTGGFTPSLIGQSTTIVSSAVITNLFNKTNNNTANLNFVNSDSSVLLNIVNIFESTNLWNTVRFTNNIFELGSIDATKADLTQGNTKSSINTIGNNIIETLVKYGTRALAEASLPIGSKFINTNSANVDPDTWFIDITMQ